MVMFEFMALLTVTLVAFTFTGILKALIHRRCDGFLEPGDWGNEFTPARYQALERLFTDADYNFVGTLPGGPRLAKQMRAKRIKIFRASVACLARDFFWACRTTTVLMMRSAVDRSELTAALSKERMAFALAIVSMEYRLLFYRLGLITFNMSAFLEPFESLRNRLRALAIVAQPAPSLATT